MDPNDPVDLSGSLDPVEDKRGLGALERDEGSQPRTQDELSPSHIHHGTSVPDEFSKDPRYEGFPVHVVSSEKTRFLDPPCGVCGNLDAANFKFSNLHIGGFGSLYIYNLDQLDEGSRSGCFSCALIRAICEPYKEKNPRCRLWYYPKNTDTPGLILSIKHRLQTMVELEICAPKGTACPMPSVSHRSLTWNATMASRQISQWLNECSSDHDCYDVLSISVLPTRVLEIQGPQQVRIYLSEANERASYACLSHCWGGVVPLKLSQATLREFQQEIPWVRLPRTFKDAIEVARGLELRFLWIDSLCIVQDDEDDWRRESAMMASVYSQAFITLAASQAADSTQGLFPDPKLARYKKVYIGFDGQGKRHEFFVRYSPLLAMETDLPLLQRAWYFQENMLSPRTAHFTECFLYLACHRGFRCADQNDLYPTRHDITSKIKSGLLEKADPHMWHKVASEYSELSLTYPQDVFPALQGIAKKLQATRQCDYFAGIWGDNIMRDLLWWRADEAANFNPLRYLAPTWSWASQPGKVSWDSKTSWQKDTYLDSKFQPDAVCVSISTTPVGDDSLGEVSSGELRLQGSCLSAVLLQFEDCIDPYLIDSCLITLKDIGFDEIKWKPDFNPCQLPDKNVTIIYMGTCESYPVCLVLTRMGTESEEYRRVGIIWVGGPLREANDFRDICVDRGERKIVTIV